MKGREKANRRAMVTTWEVDCMLRTAEHMSRRVECRLKKVERMSMRVEYMSKKAGSSLAYEIHRRARTGLVHHRWV